MRRTPRPTHDYLVHIFHFDGDVEMLIRKVTGPQEALKKAMNKLATLDIKRRSVSGVHISRKRGFIIL